MLESETLVKIVGVIPKLRSEKKMYLKQARKFGVPDASTRWKNTTTGRLPSPDVVMVIDHACRHWVKIRRKNRRKEDLQQILKKKMKIPLEIPWEMLKKCGRPRATCLLKLLKKEGQEAIRIHRKGETVELIKMLRKIN